MMAQQRAVGGTRVHQTSHPNRKGLRHIGTSLIRGWIDSGTQAYSGGFQGNFDKNTREI